MVTRARRRHPLRNPGTSQAERRLAALAPDSAPVDDRSLEDLIVFCDRFSAHVRLPSLEGGELTWQGFFDLFRGRSEREIRAEAAARPHAALFLIFLRLFRHAQDDQNDLTRRHLEHYYRHILGLAPKPPVPDSVHLLMEMAKGHVEVRVPAGTGLATAEGLRYLTRDEIFVDGAAIRRLHSIFVDPRPPHALRHALVADSADGMGARLPEERPFWRGFGDASLPRMEVGFALASPSLLLREGERSVTALIRIKAPGAPKAPSASALKAALAVYFSGEKGWLGPFEPAEAALDEAGRRLAIRVRVGAEQDPVVFFDPTQLEGGFDTLAPVMKVMVRGGDQADPYDWLKRVEIESVKLEVDVEGMKDLVVENDLGRLDPAKPFLPFGPVPKKGSSLYVGSDETFSKTLTGFDLTLRWSDLPGDDLAAHYRAYQSDRLGSKAPALTEGNLAHPVVAGNGHFTATLALTQRGVEPKTWPGQALFKSAASAAVTLPAGGGASSAGIGYAQVVKIYGRPIKRARVLFPHSTPLLTRPVRPYIQPLSFLTASVVADRFRRPSLEAIPTIRAMDRIGYVRLTLEKDFLHPVFPYYYAAALADDTSELIPNPPYTPTLQSLQLAYRAATGWISLSGQEGDPRQSELRLFHITPYGQREVHAALHAALGFDPDDQSLRLVPRFDAEGGLYIGLAGVRPETALSLLLQVAEGTANPQKSRRDIRWSVLVANHWRALHTDEIVADGTNGLLRSGIVRLLIPGEATRPNTWMDPELTWLRAEVDRHADAVCELQAVHTQAVRAQLADVSANPPHLADALPPNSLAKLQPGRAGIKQAHQPYASFGGRAREPEAGFHTRVSERLRHKQRAVTLWDYERIVLEEFPQLHRVRCLNHTAPDALEAPGHLTLLCVPETYGRNSFDRLRPRVDLDTISAIADRLAALTGPFVRVHVTSPDYEAVKIKLKIRLRAGRPFGSYQTLLNEDLTGFLAPWTRRAGEQPAFGERLPLSRLVAFIDGLEYVDYIQDLQMGVADESGAFAAVDVAEPTGPGSILTSHPLHQITEAAS